MPARVGRRIPELTLVRHDGVPVPPADPGAWTVLHCFPGAFVPGVQGLPPYWADIPGAPGCTLESSSYARRAADFAAAGAPILGASTQRPDQLAAFAAHAELPFPLLCDADERLARRCCPLSEPPAPTGSSGPHCCSNPPRRCAQRPRTSPGESGCSSSPARRPGRLRCEESSIFFWLRAS